MRAKTLYDRLGVISEGGKIRFYDSDAHSSSAPHGDQDPAKKAAAAAAAAVNEGNHSTSTNTRKTTVSNPPAAGGGGGVVGTGGAGAGVGHRDHDLD